MENVYPSNNKHDMISIAFITLLSSQYIVFNYDNKLMEINI